MRPVARALWLVLLITLAGVAGGDGALAAGGGVAAGTFHSCALAADGGAQCWGAGGFGQLGNGATVDHLSPVDVLELDRAVQLGAGDYHTCALTSDGGVRCWGLNLFGMLGDGTTTDASKPVETVDLEERVMAISVQHLHACALLASGGVRCWGTNYYADLGTGDVTEHERRPVPVVGLGEPAQAIVAGGHHNCGVLESGRVRCWGLNLFGQLGAPSEEACEPFPAGSCSSAPLDVEGLADVQALAAGAHHTCALTSGGEVWCWGQNLDGQLGDGTGENSVTPVQVVALEEPVTAIDAGFYHNCAVIETGGVVCWGRNLFGQLGDGTQTDRGTPVAVAGLDGPVTSLALGADHSCAVLVTGNVRCWGYNATGQLGDGTTEDSARPRAVNGLRPKATTTAPVATPAGTEPPDPPPTTAGATLTQTAVAPGGLPSVGGQAALEARALPAMLAVTGAMLALAGALALGRALD